MAADRVSLENVTKTRRALKPSSQVVCRRLGDGAVLVHLATNQIYELNASGCYLWRLIEAGYDKEAILDAVQQEFSVTSDRLNRQLDELIALLSHERLITGDHDARLD